MALTHLRGRAELFLDLERAVEPDSARSVLVVFGFKGLKEHLDELSLSEGDSLIERLGQRLTLSIRDAGRLYYPRRGEFCALFEGDLKPGWTMIPASLDEEMWAIGVRTAFTVVVLPTEASTPTLALERANRALRIESGHDLRP